jgi:Fic family protein
MKKTPLKTLEVGFSDVFKCYPTQPPEGYYSASQIASKYGLCISTVNAKLRKLESEGKAKSILVRQGKQIVKHYKEV